MHITVFAFYVLMVSTFTNSTFGVDTTRLIWDVERTTTIDHNDIAELVSTQNCRSNAGEEIDWQVISSGGTDGSSTNYQLVGTAGQIAVGSGSSTNYGLNQGFWQDFGGGGGPDYVCGDADGNDIVEITDAVYLINYVFVPGSPAPDPYESGDVDCNTIVEITDAVYLISYVFVPGSPAPCDPDGDGTPDC